MRTAEVASAHDLRRSNVNAAGRSLPAAPKAEGARGASLDAPSPRRTCRRLPYPHRSDGYRRRRPEESVLYQVVAEHWPLLREELEQAGGVPRFVMREFEEYLRCGILEEGCLHLVCRKCGLSQVVALSCKKRGFCPACLGRRMSTRFK